MVECEFDRTAIYKSSLVGFNRYMVECESRGPAFNNGEGVLF